MRHFIIISSFLVTITFSVCLQTFGQVKKEPYTRLVRIGDTANYVVNPTGKYELIKTALERLLLVDSLINSQDTIIVCLDRYDIFVERVVEKLDKSQLPMKFGSYVIKYMDRASITKAVANKIKPVRFVLIREIIDYHSAARILLTSKLQLPKKIKNFSDKEYFVLYEYSLKNNHFEFLPEMSQKGWELVVR